MGNKFEDKPLYRLFNVILFFLYSIAVIITIFATYLMFSSRPVTKATVECKDGTSWNVTKVYWNDEALCGVCTNRSSDGTKYTECPILNLDRTSYLSVKKQYGWSWETLLVPLLTFAISFSLVDTVRVIVLYIISGKILLEKSLLLKILQKINQS